MTELYRFARGSQTWYLTDHGRDYTHDGIKYQAIGIERDGITDEDINKCDTEVRIPHPVQILNENDEDLTDIFDRKIYFGTVYLTIMELKNDGSTRAIFQGRVDTPGIDDQSHQIVLPCFTGERDFNREITTPVYQSPCPHKLYNRMCGLKFEDWTFEVTVTSVVGQTIHFEMNDENLSFDVGYLDGGLILKDGIYYSIGKQTSATSVQLYLPNYDLEENDVVLFAPGCDQTLTMCYERFQNNLRHGGCPNVPNVNPVGHSIM